MMNFKKSGAHQIATNSLKYVAITRSSTGYWLVLPFGDLYDDAKQMHCYHTFEEAQRHAEAKVGIKFNLEDAN